MANGTSEQVKPSDLLAAIKAGLETQFDWVESVETWPNNRDRLQTPALLVEIGEMDVGDDPGTGETKLNCQVSIYVVIRDSQETDSVSSLDTAASIAAYLRLNRFGLPVGPSFVRGAYPDVWQPELEEFNVWRVDYETSIRVGEDGFAPGESYELQQVWLGRDPNTGSEHVDDYKLIYDKDRGWHMSNASEQDILQLQTLIMNLQNDLANKKLTELADVDDTNKGTGRLLSVASDGSHEYVDPPQSGGFPTSGLVEKVEIPVSTTDSSVTLTPEAIYSLGTLLTPSDGVTTDPLTVEWPEPSTVQSWLDNYNQQNGTDYDIYSVRHRAQIANFTQRPIHLGEGQPPQQAGDPLTLVFSRQMGYESVTNLMVEISFFRQEDLPAALMVPGDVMIVSVQALVQEEGDEINLSDYLTSSELTQEFQEQAFSVEIQNLYPASSQLSASEIYAKVLTVRESLGTARSVDMPPYDDMVIAALARNAQGIDLVEHTLFVKTTDSGVSILPNNATIDDGQGGETYKTSFYNPGGYGGQQADSGVPLRLQPHTAAILLSDFGGYDGDEDAFELKRILIARDPSWYSDIHEMETIDLNGERQPIYRSKEVVLNTSMGSLVNVYAPQNTLSYTEGYHHKVKVVNPQTVDTDLLWEATGTSYTMTVDGQDATSSQVPTTVPAEGNLQLSIRFVTDTEIEINTLP